MRSFPHLSLLLLVIPGALFAQAAPGGHADPIESALSAAPASVADRATVVDHSGAVLRQGDNGWICMPDPEAPNNSPMCLDEPWQELIDALMNQRQPSVSRIGISYMLQGDMPVSNIDPYATAPTADNQWLHDGLPHIMLVVPDNSILEGISTDPANGGPWVMWKGTPYAHVMIPTVPRTD